jgi:hypothetical protein
MKYETTLVRHLFPLIVLSSAVTITAFAQSDISGPAPAIVAGDLDAELGELDAETRMRSKSARRKTARISGRNWSRPGNSPTLICQQLSRKPRRRERNGMPAPTP